MTNFRATPLGPEDVDELVSLHQRCGLTCYCRYWHFEGNTDDWHDRLFNDTVTNETALRDTTRNSEESARGMVARAPDSSAVVGWLNLSRADQLPKLYGQRLYRTLDIFGGDRSGVFTLSCLLVDPEFRKQGVASALISAAIGWARSLGGTAIEAFPRRDEYLSDAELWLGPFSTLESLGFEIVHDFGPYPVLRCPL